MKIIPKIPLVFQKTKKENVIPDTESLLTLEVIEYLVREIYNIDWLVDDHYKNLIIEKSCKLIQEYLPVNIDKHKVDLVNEKNNTINRIRKKGRPIIDIQEQSDIPELFCKKNACHYKLFKFLKKNYCFNKIETHEFLNYIQHGLTILYYEKENEDNMMELSVQKKYIKLTRKYTIISFLKQLCVKFQLKIRII